LITRHVEIFSRLKHMVQVEMSFACTDEGLRRKVENLAPSNKKRLSAIKALSEAGVFVRVMAMPFVEDKDKCLELRQIVFDHGAKAFKHKGLNYFDLKDLLEGRIIRKKRRQDFVFGDLIVKSGELIKENGEPQNVRLLMPEKWAAKKDLQWQDKLVEKEVPLINSGYSECNDVEWGYIR
jgi:DNA repair photolyase